MKVNFSKYQGTGNDFIIIDNFEKKVKHNSKLAIKLCNRNFGIGSDGLIIIEKSIKADFDMIFYNPDGNQSFCGNGSRCAVKFAIDKNLITKPATTFLSTDGLHNGFFKNHLIEISMNEPIFFNASSIEINKQIIEFDLLNTGSPHLILYYKKKTEIDNIDVKTEGSKIRYNDEFRAKGGVNVNFVSKINNSKIYIRTYERGVENETLSCGTGVTASAISFHSKFLDKDIKTNNIEVNTKGGKLNVKFDFDGNSYKNIKLCGSADFLFSGIIEI